MVFAPSDEDADSIDHAFGETEATEPVEQLAELQRQVAQMSEMLTRVLDT
jgi:hypothetical protein